MSSLAVWQLFHVIWVPLKPFLFAFFAEADRRRHTLKGLLANVTYELFVLIGNGH